MVSADLHGFVEVGCSPSPPGSPTCFPLTYIRRVDPSYVAVRNAHVFVFKAAVPLPRVERGPACPGNRHACCSRGRLQLVVVVALVDQVPPGAGYVEGLTQASSVMPVVRWSEPSRGWSPAHWCR